MSLDKKHDETFVEDVQHDGKESPSLTGHNVAFQTGLRPPKSSEERQAALAAAQLLDPGIKIRSMVGLQFVWIVLTVCWCGGGENCCDSGGSPGSDANIRICPRLRQWL